LFHVKHVTRQPTLNPGFLIDLDGLLINSEELSKLAFERMCSQLGCVFSDDYHASIQGKKKSQWAQEFVDGFSLGSTADEVAVLHTRLLLKEMDRSVRLMPGAEELLEWIRDNEYPRVLVTSSDLGYARTYLGKLGIQTFFEQMVTAEDVKFGKPNPDPYLLGASRIQKDPGSCYVFEDSVNGVLSGKAAGATVIAVPSTGSDTKGMEAADYIVSTLIDALEVLKSMGL